MLLRLFDRAQIRRRFPRTHKVVPPSIVQFLCNHPRNEGVRPLASFRCCTAIHVIHRFHFGASMDDYFLRRLRGTALHIRLL